MFMLMPLSQWEAMNAFLCSSGVSEWLRLESKCCITILKCRYWMNSLFFSLVYGFYTGQWFRVWNLIVSSQDLLRFFWHCCVGRHAVWDSAHFAHSHLEGWSGPLTTKLNFIGNIWSESFYLNNAFLFFLLRTNGWLMDFFFVFVAFFQITIIFSYRSLCCLATEHV